MEHDREEIISVKAVLDCECKRFGISATSTFSNFVSTLSSVFACEISNIQYKDGENDLVCMGSEEEFLLALQSVPKTGGILRLVLVANLCPEVNTECCTELPCSDIELIDTNENDVSIEEANRRSNEMLTEILDTIKVNCTDDKDSKVTSGENKKSAIRHKFESASQLSKDLNFISSEVTGRIPVLAPSSVGSLESHFTSQKPGARKVRRVSSGTTSGGTEKNDKKQGRGRQTQRKKKRKHRDSSSSSSDSSTSRSSTSSSSSSSGSSCEENYHYYKKSNKKKRKSSPTVSIEKILNKCEKHITEKVSKDMDKYTKNFKDDIISAVTSSILQKLDGAVLQSFVVPNGVTPQPSEADVGSSSSKPGEAVSTTRMRYQHQNVVCDHCENEIFGPRYKCGNCSDYDLCEKCEAIEGLHTPSHVFVKMHFPAVHAGRRSVGGKSRPLLRANIYEEREKEREMEDLLQRKLDSGSELNQKVMEKFEKRRTKMKEDEQAKEAYDTRKEEWKKMKKEIKKNKKELAKKFKQQGKMMQRNIARGVSNNKEEILLSKEGFCFDVDSLPKVEHKIVKEPDFMEPSSIKIESKTQDDKLSSALSSLQIIQGAPALVNDACISDDNASVSNDVIIDLTTDSDDVVVVDKELVPLHLEINACSGVEILKKPDLVDFNQDVAESTTSEDFVVVSNYFDLSVPIDNKHVLEHRNCESCHNCLNNFSPDFIQPNFPEPCATTANELPMDLVASVPVTARNQPDIASVSTVNIMDQSIESFSSVSSSPPISPEPLTVIPSDAPLQEFSLIHPADDIIQPTDDIIQPTDDIIQPTDDIIQPTDDVIQPTDDVIQPTDDLIPMDDLIPTDDLIQPTDELNKSITPQSSLISNENIISEPIPTSSEAILIQPGPSEVNLCKPIVELHSSDEEYYESANHEDVINVEQQHTGGGEALYPVLNTEFNVTNQQTVDLTNPIIQSQIEREEMIQSNEYRINCTGSFNSSESCRTEVCDSQEAVSEEPVLPNEGASSDVNGTASNSHGGGFSGALVGAMASIVDTVAQVVQSAKGPAKAEYKNGEVEVTIPVDPKIAGMKKLLDMGFFDRPLNERLLLAHSNDVGRCVADLIVENNNQWFQTRH